MDQIKINENTKEIHSKTKNGIIFLFIRSAFLNILKTCSVLVLAKFLTPKDYGIYGVLNSWVGVCYFIGDIGLTGALIYQKENPSKKQYQTVLFFQLLIACFYTSIFWLVSNKMISFHNLESDSVWMIRLLSLSIIIYSLKNIPRIGLERELNFKIIAWAEVIESISMYLVQITLAVLGYGAWSFILANLVRAISGTFFMVFSYKKYFLPRFYFIEFKKLLSYGVPFQLNAIIPSLKGLIFPLILNTLLGVESLGLIVWTFGICGIFQVLAYNYNQVFFPSLSRLQHNPESFSHMATRGIEVSFLLFGLFFGLAAICSGPGIDFFFDMKWAMAKSIMPIVALSMLISTASYLCASILNAVGRPGLRLKIEVLIFILEYITAYIGAKLYGVQGYLNFLVITNCVGLILTLFAVKGVLRTSGLWRLFSVLISSSACYFIITKLINPNLFIYLIVTLILYPFINVIIDKSSLKDINKIFTETFAKISRGGQSDG